MIYFELLGERYKLKTNWSEITLREAIELAKVQPPEILIQIAKGEKTKHDMTFSDETIVLPMFYKQAIKCLCSVDTDKLTNIEAEMLFTKNLVEIMVDIINPPIDGKFPECRSIMVDGIEMVFPDEKNILGMNFPMANESTDTMIDVSNLFVASRGISEGNFKYLANMLSIMMRPKDEVYDENTSLERAEKFMDVTMDKVFGVFFYLYRSTDGLKQPIQKYLEKVRLIQDQMVTDGTRSSLLQPTTGMKKLKESAKQMCTRFLSLSTKKSNK